MKSGRDVKIVHRSKFVLFVKKNLYGVSAWKVFYVHESFHISIDLQWYNTSLKPCVSFLA